MGTITEVKGQLEGAPQGARPLRSFEPKWLEPKWLRIYIYIYIYTYMYICIYIYICIGIYVFCFTSNVVFIIASIYIVYGVMTKHF